MPQPHWQSCPQMRLRGMAKPSSRESLNADGVSRLTTPRLMFTEQRLLLLRLDRPVPLFSCIQKGATASPSESRPLILAFLYVCLSSSFLPYPDSGFQDPSHARTQHTYLMLSYRSVCWQYSSHASATSSPTPSLRFPSSRKSILYNAKCCICEEICVTEILCFSESFMSLFLLAS